MAKYRLTPAAKKDLKEIWHYSVETWGSEKAQQYSDHIEEAILNLVEYPEMGRLRPEIRDGYRSMKTGKHIIFYRNNDSFLDIARILHERMDTEPFTEDNL